MRSTVSPCRLFCLPSTRVARIQWRPSTFHVLHLSTVLQRILVSISLMCKCKPSPSLWLQLHREMMLLHRVFYAITPSARYFHLAGGPTNLNVLCLHSLLSIQSALHTVYSLHSLLSIQSALHTVSPYSLLFIQSTLYAICSLRCHNDYQFSRQLARTRRIRCIQALAGREFYSQTNSNASDTYSRPRDGH